MSYFHMFFPGTKGLAIKMSSIKESASREALWSPFQYMHCTMTKNTIQNRTFSTLIGKIQFQKGFK